MNPDPEAYDPTLLAYVDDFFVGLSPTWRLVDTLGLLALAIWPSALAVDVEALMTRSGQSYPGAPQQ